MFFGLFKRTPTPPAKPKRGAAPSRSSWRPTEPAGLSEPSSLEVTEGNDPTDWELWQDSVNCFDSQLRSLQPSVKLYRQQAETPTEFQDIDAFARVRRKDL